jgi:tetraacyldisaccharide 4'-kinase
MFKSPLLLPLAMGFQAGVAVRRAAYRRGWFRVRRLNRPVVSIGNLSVGGTGKTPLVAYVAQRLVERGWRPSILTRGYRRGPGPRLVAIAPRAGRSANPQEVGDEVAWLAAALPDVPIVVARDRYQAGRLAEHHFNVQIHLLDDGFQHWALHRDVDILALDTTRPLAGEALLPLGRLREPPPALRRAHVAVLTRVEVGDAGSLEANVRAIHPQIKIFHGAVRLSGLASIGPDRRRNLPPDALAGKPVLAFCGIGNPEAFFADLQLWGFSVIARESFRDHHRYGRSEVARLVQRARAAGAAALLTTEKDAINLPAAADFELPAMACRTGIELAECEGFLETVVGLAAAGAANGPPGIESGAVRSEKEN